MSDEAHQRVVTSLDAMGADYEILECDPDLADTEVYCEKYGVPLECSFQGIAKTSIVIDKQQRAAGSLDHPAQRIYIERFRHHVDCAFCSNFVGHTA